MTLDELTTVGLRAYDKALGDAAYTTGMRAAVLAVLAEVRKAVPGADWKRSRASRESIFTMGATMSDTIKIAERLRDWMSIGPVQRAAVYDALAQAREQGRQAGLEEAVVVMTDTIYGMTGGFMPSRDATFIVEKCVEATRALKEKP